MAERECIRGLQGYPRVRDARHPGLSASHVIPGPPGPLRAARVDDDVFRNGSS